MAALDPIGHNRDPTGAGDQSDPAKKTVSNQTSRENMPKKSAKPAVLYVSSNNGSDTRIVKEVRTLSRVYDVHFLGVGSVSESSFARNYCASFKTVRGSIRSIGSVFWLLKAIASARIRVAPSSIHVVNEQLLAVLWPALIGKRIVLDVFDSMFLRMNKPKNQYLLAKRALYAFASRIVVTDQYRHDLLADFAKPRSVVIPNVPLKSAACGIIKNRPDALTLSYFGSLAENRGTALLRALLEAHPDIRVLCAGWPADDASKLLAKHPNVSNLGVIDQNKANELIARDADYILSVYPSGNLNNYYASPNKLYDAIHTRTPLVIGDNVKVSEFVEEYGLGLVACKELLDNPGELGTVLKQKRSSFQIDPGLIEEFCWERFEAILIDLHRFP